MTSIALYAARIASLLEPATLERRTESLPLGTTALAADPASSDRRILAKDVLAALDLPRFDNAQMDGFAVRAADLTAASAASPVALDVAPPVPAGEHARPHVLGTAVPVMTGSPIPPGADAVVRIEDVDPPRFPADSAIEEGTTASFASPVATGTFVRPTGSDLRTGEILLTAGTVLRAAQYGVLATIGATEVEVLARPRVLVVPTGNEIRLPGEVLEDAQIYDANGPILAEALREVGAVAVVRPCKSDRAEDLLALLAEHSGDVDLVVTIGGVSKGAYEVVRDALEPLGAVFGHVDMQPGGPQGNGMLSVDGGRTHVPVVSFPGNPVSALVSFEVFLRPILSRRTARVPAERPSSLAPLAEAIDSPERVHQVRRGRVGEDGSVTPVGGPSSHLLHSYASSNALLHIPVGTSRLEAGSDVLIWRIDG